MFDFSNPGHAKISILALGVNIDRSLMGEIGTKYQEKIYSYSITDWVNEKVALPSELRIGGRSYAGFHFRESSPIRIDKRENGSLYAQWGDSSKIDVNFIERPRYYSHTLPDGTPLSAVGCSCANHGVSFFILDHCQYFNNEKECAFCTLVPTQKRFNDTLKYKKLDQVEYTLRSIVELGDRLDFIQLSGGSIVRHDREVSNYLRYITKIREVLSASPGYETTKIHLTCMPPHDLCLIQELKGAGLDTISFDTECVTQSAFERYCPGKSHSYGFHKMHAALDYALDEFGKNNVFTIVIAGIEPLEIFSEGVSNLIARDIVPTINVYHHDPLTVKMDVQEPDPYGLVIMAESIAPKFHENKIIPGALGCAHYDIGHDIRKGFFDVR